MERTAINPVQWSVALGFEQGTLVTDPGRTLYCSGQTAMNSEGAPEHEGDMAAQLSLALDNLDAVLAEAAMSISNLVKLGIYTTDIDLLFRHYGLLMSRLLAAGVTPATTMVEVSRLAVPGQMIEIDGIAVA
ncbi:RidA family protein [Rhodococcus sp. KRD162]|uniref:RidA family protein n=1 Tax=Rhodococcus sp. KRD162 TaxID=2729725 RepID=UPI0019CFE438|nr:RidA family protein [Rhodococcus sp. KRD162]